MSKESFIILRIMTLLFMARVLSTNYELVNFRIIIHMLIMNSQTQHVRGILVVAILAQVPTVECSPCCDITTLELMTL